MGHCISDNTAHEERFKTVKLFDDDKIIEEGDEEFCTKKMNENVVQPIESFKRA